jgi:hypothetical protein
MNPASFLCENGNGHHNTELRTYIYRHITGQHVQQEVHYVKPGANSIDTDNSGHTCKTQKKDKLNKNTKHEQNTDPQKKRG